MTKGQTVIVDHDGAKHIARVVKGGATRVTVRLEDTYAEVTVAVTDCLPVMQLARDEQIYPGQELWMVASTGGWIKVTVTHGDLRRTNRSIHQRQVMVRDALRGQEVAVFANDLCVDLATQLRSER